LKVKYIASPDYKKERRGTHRSREEGKKKGKEKG
jgi:hypothetical protein